ncbi:hypothetical protein L218DRAFT_962904 [Marasmius fiardii PR-910]|nr:hypothetical protein L218DRAFT_962904 [Marasmius fiardii PR-910]
MDSKQQQPQQAPETHEAPPPQYAEASRDVRPPSQPQDRPYPQSQPSNVPSPSPHPVAMQPPPQALLGQEKTPAQMGEEYRAALFAECAQGRHAPTTRYGPCGIITAILCFPCGLLCLYTDSEQKCDRCGIIIPK